jgi:hypothetical protein
MLRPAAAGRFSPLSLNHRAANTQSASPGDAQVVAAQEE